MMNFAGMATLLGNLSGLSLSDQIDSSDKKPNSFIEDSFNSLLIHDDLVSQQCLDNVKLENNRLNRNIKELKDYIMTLHKMIALLRKQNAVLAKNDQLSSKIESLTLQDAASELLEEEQILTKIIQHKQQALQEQILSNKVFETKANSELQSLKDHQKLLHSQMENISNENSSLSDANERLKSIVKVREDELQVMQNKLNVCSSIIEEQSKPRIMVTTPDESKPWIVVPNEIEISSQILGTGAWGTVSLGTFRGLTVAVKQLHRLILSPHNQEKFLREMEISSRIRHPHILQFICCSQQAQTLLVITEVMELSAREGYLSNRLSKSQSVKVLLQCGLALQYLHGFKPVPIIHRDISSCNVLLSSKSSNTWVAKLSDFGAANFLRDELSCAPGAAIYAAPEAYSNIQNTKLDVFSFGVLMMELLTHRLPDPSLREQHLHTVPHVEVKEVIRSMLSRHPEQRPDMSSVVGTIRVASNLPSGVASDCL